LLSKHVQAVCGEPLLLVEVLCWCKVALVEHAGAAPRAADALIRAVPARSLTKQGKVAAACACLLDDAMQKLVLSTLTQHSGCWLGRLGCSALKQRTIANSISED
jgi:hypothetical protein